MNLQAVKYLYNVSLCSLCVYLITLEDEWRFQKKLPLTLALLQGEVLLLTYRHCHQSRSKYHAGDQDPQYWRRWHSHFHPALSWKFEEKGVDARNVFPCCCLSFILLSFSFSPSGTACFTYVRHDSLAIASQCACATR